MQNPTGQTLETAPVQEVLKSHKKRRVWLWLLLLGLGAGGAYYYFIYLREPEVILPTYQTAHLEQGDVTATLLVTGTLQPLKQVDISTEISGQVMEVKVSSGASVKTGDVLARLDPKQQEDAIDKAKAALISAKANAAQSRTQVTQADVKIIQAEAGLRQAQATMRQTVAQTEQAETQVAQQGNTIQQELANIETAQLAIQEAKTQLNRLLALKAETNGKLPSAQELETARVNLQKAQNQEKVNRASLKSAQQQAKGSSANVRSSQASHQANQANLDSVKAAIDSAKAERISAIAGLESAEANVASAEAALRTETNKLSKTTITSPLNGVVLKQSIETGQTVFATASTPPVLFTLIDSLQRMRLRVFVDETNIGLITTEQTATFTVDAWPKNSYKAKITSIGINAETKENIVTYPVDFEVNNEDLRLKPGMTATTSIALQQVKNVLKVPNAALYYVPSVMPALENEIDNEPKQASAPVSTEPTAVDTTDSPPDPTAAEPNENVNQDSDTPTSTPPSAEDENQAQIWVLKDKTPYAVTIKKGLTDGKFTEVAQVISGELPKDAQVIVGEEELESEIDPAAAPPLF